MRAKGIVLPMWILLALALDLSAGGPRPYQCGKLLDMESEQKTRIFKGTENPAGIIFNLTVHVGDIVYTVEYKAKWKWSYQPTDFIVGDYVAAGLEKDKLYLCRLGESGKELKTKIRKRERAGFFLTCPEP